MRVVVTVGTDEHPFDRLVARCRELVAAGHEVWVQAGSSREPVPGAEVHALVPLPELRHQLEQADVVVTHGGPGSIWLALECGQVPLVVPRDPEHGEHIDDHQLRFARHLQGRVHVISSPGGLLDAVTHHRVRTEELDPPSVGPERRAAYARAVGDVVEELVGSSAFPGTDGRATVAASRDSSKS